VNDLSQYDPIEDDFVIKQFEDLRDRWKTQQGKLSVSGENPSYEDWLEREFLNQNFAVDNLSDALNSIWGLMYPDDPTRWDYPGQVFNHIRIYIEEVRGNRGTTNQEAGSLVRVGDTGRIPA